MYLFNLKRLRNIPLILLVVFFSGCSDDDSSTSVTDIRIINIGVLSSESGDFSSGGAMLNNGLALAAVELNELYDNYDIELRISDTETSPIIASTLFSYMVEWDVDLVIGPLTSAELLHIKDNSDFGSVLVVSPPSSSPSLSIADDTIYRMVCDDIVLAEALVEVMWFKGVRYLATMHRPDNWGNCIDSLVTLSFTEKGGTVLSSFEYYPYESIMISQQYDSLKQILIIDEIPVEQVGLQFSSFDEGLFLLDLAFQDTLLNQIQWFGSDGFVQNSDLLDMGLLAEFAAEVNYLAPIYGIPETEESSDFKSRFIAEYGVSPSSHAYLAYDALKLSLEAKLNAGEEATLAELMAELENLASTTTGVSGDLSFNEYGDRSFDFYDFWTVVPDGNGYRWDRALTYSDGVITEE